MNPVRSIFLLLLAACLALSSSAMAETDPPGRVARLALADGAVFLLDHDTREWSNAQGNWPVTTGDVLHSGADGRAELRIGSGAIRLDSGTEIELRQLDDEQIRIWLEYGSVALRVRSHDPADWITVDTRDGRVLATEPGQYRIDYADGTTTLTVHQGELGFFAEDSQTTVTDGQRIEVRYAQRTVYRSTAIVRDAFAHWYLARDARDDTLGQPRYVSAEMTGAEELERHTTGKPNADRAQACPGTIRLRSEEASPRRTVPQCVVPAIVADWSQLATMAVAGVVTIAALRSVATDRPSGVNGAGWR